MTSGRSPVIARRLVGSRILMAALTLLGLSSYLIILSSNRLGTLAAPQWIQLIQCLIGLAAITAYLVEKPRYSKLLPLRSYPSYFQLATLGIIVSMIHIVVGMHWDSINTAASTLQTVAWLMTTWLAARAARNRYSQQAQQWLARSLAISATCVVLPLLSLLPHYHHVHADSIGLQKGIVVFAAFLAADIYLNWRQITTARA